jgi:alpha-beta hydrolase superfamily lysophospholipase
MREENFFTCSDGHKSAYYVWLPDQEEEPRYFLQIIHGMVEHSLRYERFAKFLNENGVAVFAADQRGHGKTIGEDTPGHFGEKDGWMRVAEDNYELAEFVKKTYKPSEIFLMGHSMGSFLARTVMVKHPGFYKGVTIMGTGSSQGIVGKAGKLIARMEIRRKGSAGKGNTMNKLAFGPYAKSVKNASTEFDWLSTDPEEVQKYLDDPLCGFVCTNMFYLDLLYGVEFANSRSKASKLPKDLPLLIISGEDDPVGGKGRGVRKVYDLYKRAGIKDVSIVLVKGGRHEILNEKMSKEVFDQIYNWMEARK